MIVPNIWENEKCSKPPTRKESWSTLSSLPVQLRKRTAQEFVLIRLHLDGSSIHGRDNVPWVQGTCGEAQKSYAVGKNIALGMEELL